jgi:SOS-response transcriptional repressor LexA
MSKITYESLDKFIKEYAAEHGYCPTQEEMGKNFRVTQPDISYHIHRYAAAGYCLEDNRHRIRLREKEK